MSSHATSWASPQRRSCASSNTSTLGAAHATSDRSKFLAEVTRKLGLSTTAIHGGAAPVTPGMGVSAPLIQSVNYAQETGTSEGLLYTRYGNTPNAERVQRRLALLEGSEEALVLSSGMGATACAM